MEGPNKEKSLSSLEKAQKLISDLKENGFTYAVCSIGKRYPPSNSHIHPRFFRSEEDAKMFIEKNIQFNNVEPTDSQVIINQLSEFYQNIDLYDEVSPFNYNLQTGEVYFGR